MRDSQCINRDACFVNRDARLVMPEGH